MTGAAAMAAASLEGGSPAAGEKPPAASQPDLLAKFDVADLDPSCRKSSVETMKALMHREVHDSHSLGLFIDTLLGAALDKKTMQKHLILASTSTADSLPALSIAALLAEITHHASQVHLKLSLHHISSIARLMVSWFALPVEAASQTQSLHQACSKLACAIAENAAVHPNSDARCSPSTCSSPSFTGNADENSGSNLDSSSSSFDGYEDSPSTEAAMESLCRPLIFAAFTKSEPAIRGGTTCLQALVSMDSWRFAPLSLIEELCIKAVNSIQERKALSVSTAQMSLLCLLAKENCESLSSFRAGLLKKAGEILLIQSGQWQQRVAAARLIECLLSIRGHCNVSSKHELQTIDALEQCRFDKVAMVRSAVTEALRKVKQQQTQGTKCNERLSPGLPSAARSSASKSSSAAADYGRRRRKKPLQGTQFPSSSRTRANESFSGIDGWISRITPSSGWSSSDSVNSSIDMICPRRKVAKTHAVDGAKEAVFGKGSHSGNHTSSSPPSTVSLTDRLQPSSHVPPSLASSGAVVPLSDGCSAESAGKVNAETASVRSWESMNSAFMGLQGLGEEYLELSILNPEDEDNVCLSDNFPNDHTFGSEKECNSSCGTPTHVHHNPIAGLEDLEVLSREVCEPATELVDDMFPTIPINLVMPRLERLEPQTVNSSEDMRRRKPFNDTAWNVRTNPIATDDSEIDSPRATLLENCSIIYCDDGDDEDEDRKLQGVQKETSHASRRKENEECVCGRHHGCFEDSDRDYAMSHCSSITCPKSDTARERRKWCNVNNGKEHQTLNIMRDGEATNESTSESYDCSSDIEDPERLLKVRLRSLSFECSTVDMNTRQFSLIEALQASSVKDESINHRPKEIPMDDYRIEEASKTCQLTDRIAHACSIKENSDIPKEILMDREEVKECTSTCHGLNKKAHECVPKGYDDDCHLLSQDSQREDATCEEKERRFAQGGHICTGEMGVAHTVIDELSNEDFECADDSPSSVIMDEHEGAGDNFDVIVANLNSISHAVACTGEEGWEPLYPECSMPGQYQMEGSGSDAQDIQSLNIAGDLLQPCPFKEKAAFEEEKVCEGEVGGQRSQSILGWLRECYIVKKLGLFGTFFLALTVPIAIVSIISSFENEEDTNDFLVPT